MKIKISEYRLVYILSTCTENQKRFWKVSENVHSAYQLVVKIIKVSKQQEYYFGSVIALTHLNSSLSSCCVASTDFPDSLSPLLLADLVDYILFPYRILVDKFKLVIQHLHVRVKGIHRRTSLMSSSLILQPYPTCLFHLIWMVLEMGGRWPYSYGFMGCCF